MKAYRTTVVLFALAFVVLGISLLVVTTINGGGVTGYVLGALFIALGAGRLQLQRRR